MGPRSATDDLTLVGDGETRVTSGRWVRRVRVVYGEDVARLGVAVHYGRDGLGHRAEVDRDVLGLGDHAPSESKSAVEQSRLSLMFEE